MKRSQLEKYIKQAIEEAMYVDSQGNLQSDDDKIKRAGDDEEQLIYHKGGTKSSNAFFDDKINGRRVEGFWAGPPDRWGEHGRKFYVWDPKLARGGHVLGSFSVDTNQGNIDSHVFVDHDHKKITRGKAIKILNDIKKEVLKRISDGTLEEAGGPKRDDEFELSASQDDIGVDVGDMSTRPEDISQLEGTCGYKYDAVTGRKRRNTPGGLEEELDEISSLKSYIKEALKQYIKGSPWSHGIAIGHRINKYNDPELIRKRYDKAAATGFQRRPKGRLSNPRGYALNEGKTEYTVTKDDWKKSKYPFEKLKNSEFKIKIAGEGDDRKYLFFWKEDGEGDWEAGNMKRQLRSALTAIAKRKLPINEAKSCSCGCGGCEEKTLRENIKSLIKENIKSMEYGPKLEKAKKEMEKLKKELRKIETDLKAHRKTFKPGNKDKSYGNKIDNFRDIWSRKKSQIHQLDKDIDNYKQKLKT